MDIIISASKAFCKWIKETPPRLPCVNGKGKGTQPIKSTSSSIAWQCHVVKRHDRPTNTVDVIAVEARSRYAILCSNIPPFTKQKFEQVLSSRWASEAVYHSVESGAIKDDESPIMYNRFQRTKLNFHWFQNTDLSVNGHVTDAEQWLNATYADLNCNALKDSEAFELGLHINSLTKKVKISTIPNGYEKFEATRRFLDDWLFRFGKGLCEIHNGDEHLGDFPNPFERAVIHKNGKRKSIKSTKDNIISLQEVRSKLRHNE